MVQEDKKEYKEIELRSEEVQEVMSHVPVWILRWGITVLFCIVIILLIGSYLFKYPDVVEAEITVSTQNPPAYVVARVAGRLEELCVENGAVVRKEAVLGMIENSAKAEDLFLLKERMKQWEAQGFVLSMAEQLFDGQYLQLGEVQPAYASFISVLKDYASFVKQDYYRRKLESSRKLLESQKTYYQLAEKQFQLGGQEQMLIKRIYGRDSTLYKKNAMIAAEYDESERSYLQQLQNYEGMRMSLSQIEMQIEQGKESLLDVQHQALTEEQKHIVNLKNTVEQLQVSITTWEQSYLLVAPISGKLTFMSVWSNNQNVASGESVFVIAPDEGALPMGKALLPVQGSGKVKSGQEVNIRLNNYPDQEFGYVKGRVCSVSPVPTAENMYVVDIELPDGMRTNYGKDLPLTREMKGIAEIVTEDMRLIERLLAPLRKLKDKMGG